MPERHPLIDRDSAEPLYAQVAADLRAQIESRSRVPGSSLPNEQALRETYGVSRSVIRQALSRLADEGLISREQGRGTIVLPSTHRRRQARQAGGLRQQIAAMGGDLSTRIISFGPAVPPYPQENRLGTRRTWRLERVRSVDGDPVIHMVTWLPRDLTPGLTAETLGGGSLHEWLRTQGIDPQGGPRQLRAVAADEETARHLVIAEASPVTLLEGVTHDRAGRPVEAFMAFHHPSTVFDLDAEVDRFTSPERAEELISELRALIGG